MKTITKEYAARIAAGTINMIKCGGGGLGNLDIAVKDKKEYVIATVSDYGTTSLVTFFFYSDEPHVDWKDYSVSYNPMDLTGFQENMDTFADYAWLYSGLFKAAEMSEHYSDAKPDEKFTDQLRLEHEMEMKRFDIAVFISWKNDDVYSISLSQHPKIPHMYSISETFEGMKKADLIEWAEVLGYEKTSKLKKIELENLIEKELLKKETMFYRIAFLSPGTTAFFDEDKGFGCKVSNAAWDEACLIKGLGYGTMISGRLYIYSEAKNVWKKIDKKEFRAYQKRASWVWKCLYWSNRMYKYTPVKVFLQVVNARQGMRMTAVELYDIFDHFPLDENWTSRYDDVFVDYYVDNETALKKLFDQQQEKSFYIPSPAEVEELYTENALLSDPACRKMFDFLTETKGITLKGNPKDLLKAYWEYQDESASPQDDFQWFMDKVEFENETLLERFLKAYSELANNTRTAFNRGHKAIEITTPLKRDEKSVIIAGSPEAAEMLKQAEAEINALGLKVALEAKNAKVPVIRMQEDGPATISQRRIYPNDPCPCGSGKKYKKCCGKT
jgi:hypothetical protein